ncbi:hypothetical protein [Rubritalea tangerina]
MRRNLTTIGMCVGFFVLGSLKGDDLLDLIVGDGSKPLGEKVESMGRPLNADEIKGLGSKVMQESGHDMSKVAHIQGLTTKYGYVVTALGDEKQFIAQCFIHSSLNEAECVGVND